ncbi:MAG: transposase, partial [Actinobacteria bacterium]|nr:transposase [Actinomycetota bacterium]
MVTVVDRGFSSDENLRYLTRAGGHWIAGERMRDGSPDAKAALSRPGRYQAVRDNLRVKEVHIGEGDAAKRFIVCHNPTEADRERSQRDDTIRRLQAELERIETQRAKATNAKAAEAHTRAECALRDHPALGRDRAKIAGEERLDGKFLLSTSDPD